MSLDSKIGRFMHQTVSLMETHLGEIQAMADGDNLNPVTQARLEKGKEKVEAIRARLTHLLGSEVTPPEEFAAVHQLVLKERQELFCLGDAVFLESLKKHSPVLAQMVLMEPRLNGPAAYHLSTRLGNALFLYFGREDYTFLDILQAGPKKIKALPRVGTRSLMELRDLLCSLGVPEDQFRL